MENIEAFKQGYTRAMYKVMDAVHTAFRKSMTQAEIEAMMRRMVHAREIKAEAEAFIAFNEPES